MFGFLGKAFSGVVEQVQAYLPVVAHEAWNVSKAITSVTYQGITTYGPPVASAAWSASQVVAKFSFDQVKTYGPPVASAAWSASQVAAKFSYEQVATYGPPVASAAWSASKVAAQVSYDHVTTYGPTALSATWDMSKVLLGAAAQAAKKVVDAVTADAVSVVSVLQPMARSKGALVEWKSGAQADPSADEWLTVDVVDTIDTANALVLLGTGGACIKYVGECEDDYDFSSVSFVGCATAADLHLHALVAV